MLSIGGTVLLKIAVAAAAQPAAFRPPRGGRAAPTDPRSTGQAAPTAAAPPVAARFVPGACRREARELCQTPRPRGRAGGLPSATPRGRAAVPDPRSTTPPPVGGSLPRRHFAWEPLHACPRSLHSPARGGGVPRAQPPLRLSTVKVVEGWGGPSPAFSRGAPAGQRSRTGPGVLRGARAPPPRSRSRGAQVAAAALRGLAPSKVPLLGVGRPRRGGFIAARRAASTLHKRSFVWGVLNSLLICRNTNARCLQRPGKQEPTPAPAAGREAGTAPESPPSGPPRLTGAAPVCPRRCPQSRPRAGTSRSRLGLQRPRLPPQRHAWAEPTAPLHRGRARAGGSSGGAPRRGGGRLRAMCPRPRVGTPAPGRELKGSPRGGPCPVPVPVPAAARGAAFNKSN